MTTQLWLWSRTHHRWTNGKYTITEQVKESYPHYMLKNIYYCDTQLVLCKDALNYPDIPKSEWKPFTPDEVVQILDSKLDITDKWYPR